MNYPELHVNNQEVLGRGSGGSARNPKANKWRSRRRRIERGGSTKQGANMFEKGLQGSRQLFLKLQQSQWVCSNLCCSSWMRMSQAVGSQALAATELELPTSGNDTAGLVSSHPLTTLPCSRWDGLKLTVISPSVGMSTHSVGAAHTACSPGCQKVRWFPDLMSPSCTWCLVNQTLWWRAISISGQPVSPGTRGCALPCEADDLWWVARSSGWRVVYFPGHKSLSVPQHVQ